MNRIDANRANLINEIASMLRENYIVNAKGHACVEITTKHPAFALAVDCAAIWAYEMFNKDSAKLAEFCKDYGTGRKQMFQQNGRAQQLEALHQELWIEIHQHPRYQD